MLKSILLNVTSIALLFVFSGVDAFAQTPQSITVQVGKSAIESKSKMKVEFLEMIEDSRCPKEVNCVWAGNAKIKIRVSKNGRSKVMELNSGMQNKDNSFAGYTFLLDKLTPEPASNIRINRNGYVAVISISKK